MSNTREIITLHVGHYSNFVGTHWWNTQESSFCYDKEAIAQPVNHDILFREGINFRRETTYTPRLIAIDLKGSLNTLRQEGILYEVPVQKFNRNLWSGKVDVHKVPSEKKNEFLEDLEKQELMLYPELKSIESFDEDKDICIESTSSRSTLDNSQSQSSALKEYNLNESVNVWSDYLRTHFHPRSIFLLPEYNHNDEQELFDLFSLGVQAYQIEQNREDIEEKIRHFAEECDFLQGFNIIFDGYDGFAGLTSNIQQHLRDDYTNKMQFCIPVFKPSYKIYRPAQTDTVHRLFSTLFCLDAMAQYSSFFSPVNVGSRLVETSQSAINFPDLKYKDCLPYHTSAILSSVIEMLTLPTRLKNNPVSMVEMAQHLVCSGRKLLASSLCFPLLIPEQGYLSDVLENQSFRIVPQIVTPFCNIGEKPALVQSFVFCGIDNQRLFSSNPSCRKISVEELLGQHLKITSPSYLSAVTVVETLFKATSPFPNIFLDHIVSYGANKQKMEALTLTTFCTAGKEFPVAAGMQNTDSAALLLEEVTQAARKINFRKFHRCIETGIEMDDITETIDNITSFSQCYSDANRVDI